MHLLVVDDDPSILELLRTLIPLNTDHTVDTASCVTDALDLLAGPEAKAVDCFLLDIQMPETDGIALCKILRNLPDYGQTPILMLSAMSEKSYIDRASSAGANEYITKPFDLMELRRRLGYMDSHLADREKQANGVDTASVLNHPLYS